MSKKGRRPDFSSGAPYSTHPGYDQEYQCRYEAVPRRVRSAAESNYIRNRGTMNLYLDHAHPLNQGYETARPAPKARHELAMNILTKSISGSVGAVLGKSDDYDNDYHERQQQQRVRGAAVDIAEKNRGQMDDVIGNGSCYCPAPAQSRTPIPRIKPAALDHAQMCRGGAMDILLHSYTLEPDPRPQPRIKAQAEDIATHGVKGDVARLLVGALTPPSQPQPRVRSAAKDNVKKNEGAMHQLMVNSGYTPRGYSYYNQSSGDISNRSTIPGRPSSSMM